MSSRVLQTVIHATEQYAGDAFKRLAAYNGCRNVDRKGCQLEGGGRKTNASSEAGRRARRLAEHPSSSAKCNELAQRGGPRRTRGPRLEHNQQHLRAGKSDIAARVVPSGTERNGEASRAEPSGYQRCDESA
ncbi:hypothetical protein QLX08_009016 [Tetragonisca angustula]|uniref:Uncharacterized protein n=1 Tax=Tetragonisca angustula TaxID=166442 RepID=A0AAW0ZIE2_9HYME